MHCNSPVRLLGLTGLFGEGCHGNRGLVTWLTLLGYSFWFVTYWRGGQKIVSDFQESLAGGGSRVDRATVIAIALSSVGLAVTGIAFALGLLAGPGDSVAVVLVGWLLSVAGMAGMCACRRHLGKFHMVDTRVVPEHQVVDSGPYGVVRHPIYAFATVMYVGLGLAFLTWWDALLVAVVVVSYLLKVRIEDDFLAAHLPGYREYRRRVRWRVIPGVW